MQDKTINNTKIALLIPIENFDKTFNDSECDIIALKLNDNIEKSKNNLLKILPQIKKTLMICGHGKDEIDSVLLPEVIKVLDRECIISFVTEKTYKDIIPYAIKGNHQVVLKTPIDINLAKELNILCIEMGINKNKILMNTDIGGLGYGYEYGYSIMERVRLEADKGDEYLKMPLISEASSESLKTKEAKVGEDKIKLEKRARMIELSAITGAIAAGANLVLMSYPENIKIVKGII